MLKNECRIIGDDVETYKKTFDRFRDMNKGIMLTKEVEGAVTDMEW
jgi:hypothetical protein